MSYDHTNVFARIIDKTLPSNIIYEDEYLLAFEDISPNAPIHILVIPKGEYTSFSDFIENALGTEIAYFFKIVRLIAHNAGLDKTGYRLITNHGKNAHQSVAHFHMHILGGKDLGELLNNS